MFQIGDALGGGWQGFKNNIATWIISLIVMIVILVVVGAVFWAATGAVAKSQVAAIVMMIVSQLVQSVVGVFLAMGLITIALKSARGESASVGDLFANGGKIIKGFLVQLVSTVLIAIGTVLLIVPGVIIAIGLMFSLFYIVDKDMGVFEALGASWNATKGSRLTLFLFLLLAILLAIVGSIPLGLGLFVVGPVVYGAMAYIYLKIGGETAATEPAPT